MRRRIASIALAIVLIIPPGPVWRFFLPLIGVDMGQSSYILITPDGEHFNFGQPGINVAQGIPDGFGFPPLDHNTMTIYQRPGAQLTGINIKPRIVTITADAFGDCRLTLHKARAALFSALRWNRSDTDPPTASTLRYTHEGKSVDLKVYYLSDVISTQSESAQVVGVRLAAYDPMWYDPTLTTTDVAPVATPNVSYILGLINGVWSAMGNNGTGTVYAITISADGDKVYVGGNFADWAGLLNADCIALYTISTATWSALSTGISGASNYVFSIALDAMGDVYAGGSFTTAGGGAAANIAKFDTSAGTWSALGAGTNDWVRSIVIHPTNGDVYVGGEFTVPFNYIAKWSGGAWVALATDTVNGDVYALAICNNQYFGLAVVAGGAFTTADAVTLNYVGEYLIASDAWSYMPQLPFGATVGTNALVDAIAVAPNGNIYIGGAFTTAGGGAAARVAMYNGNAWFPMGSGVDAQAYAIEVDDTGLVYVSGAFTSAGGLTLVDRIATWNGTTWAQIDANLPGVATVTAIATHGYDKFFGFDTVGAVTALGEVTTVTNTGSADAYPVITVLGPGTLQYIENTITHKRMIFDFGISAGETITIDLTPGVKTITSDWRSNIFAFTTMLPQSDFATFNLAPDPIAPNGANVIRVMMTGTTAATTIYMMHYNAYLTADEAVD